MPPLTKSAEYSDLNGEESAELLAARFWAFLQTIPEFQRRFALARVILTLNVQLDIWGARPDDNAPVELFQGTRPTKIYQDSLVMSATEPLPSSYKPNPPEQATHTAHEVVDSRNNPPDQVREDHGLPVHRGQRNQAGVMETIPVILDGAPTPKYPKAPTPAQLPLPPTPATLPSPSSTNMINGTKQRRVFAAVVELDKGPAMSGQRDESAVVGYEKISTSSQGGGDVVGVQPEFRNAEFRGRALDPNAVRDQFDQHVTKVTQAENLPYANPLTDEEFK